MTILITKVRNPFLVLVAMSTLLLGACDKDSDRNPPTLQLMSGANYTSDGTVAAIGQPLHFGIDAQGGDANITNFTVKIKTSQGTRTVLDSGLNVRNFTVNETFFQGVEDTAQWIFTVMDKNRLTDSKTLTIYKDPNSTFGGIRHYPSIVMGMDENTQLGHFMDPATGHVYMLDSATIMQSAIDLLVYFKMSEDNGVLIPSATFSSPGEEGDAVLEFYPELEQWQARNYTKYDIRANNGVTPQAFADAHNDSLLIVSYDDVWGKRKYKWAVAGTIIPFMTQQGKKGLIRVIRADEQAAGIIEFEMKIQY
ncbi:MAG: hypothetical protein EOM83_09450 [Clostridia bacterium]|nr:hypothetical protein [Clostridia bacterium]